MNSSSTDTLYGLVLAGGQSKRMGTNKGRIVFHEKPQIEHLSDLLSKFCSTVYLSMSGETDESSHHNALVDKLPIKSPLNGILSAFQFHQGVAWLSVPVDMPFVDFAALQFIITHRDKSKVATCFYDSDQKYPEPLFTIWEPRAARLLLDFYQGGRISPREFLMESDVRLLNAPDQRILLNVNTPQELEHYRKKKDKI